MTARAPLHCDSHALGYNKIDLLVKRQVPSLRHGEFTLPATPRYRSAPFFPI